MYYFTGFEERAQPIAPVSSQLTNILYLELLQ